MILNQSKIQDLSESIVAELLSAMLDVSKLEVSEILTEEGYLDDYDPEHWDDITDMVHECVEEMVSEILFDWGVES